MKCAWIWFFALVVSLTSSCSTTTLRPDGEQEAEKAVSFAKDIKPLFEASCVNCHNQETMPERVSFESRELALDDSKGGVIIVPGHPESSRLLHAVKSPDSAERAMPPVSHRVSPAQIALLERWIAEGAQWPEGKEGRIRPTAIPRE